MTSLADTAPAEPQPEFWYGLPHGYTRLDLAPSDEGLVALARGVTELPSALRDRADQAFRLYAVVVRMMRRQRVQGCAFGVHPDAEGGASVSVLTVSTLPTPEGNPKAALTRLLSGDGRTGDGLAVAELPAGPGFLMETERRTVAPGIPPEGRDEPSQGTVTQETVWQGTVWQGTVAIPDMRSSSVITVQLVTPAVELADDYRGVLLGVARTVTFTDPTAPAEAYRGTGPRERNPFG